MTVEWEMLQFIKSRRSSKLLKRGKVELDKVLRAVETATYAANAHNAQPWRFIIVVDENIKRQLVDEMAREWENDLLQDGFSLEKIKMIISSASERTLRASALVIACLTMEGMHTYRDDRRNRYEYIMAVQSVAAALQNLLLALHAQGLGSCWRCSALFAPNAVRRVLGIPPDVEPQALVEIGLPGGVRPARRKPLKEVCFINRWGNEI